MPLPACRRVLPACLIAVGDTDLVGISIMKYDNDLSSGAPPFPTHPPTPSARPPLLGPPRPLHNAHACTRTRFTAAPCPCCHLPARPPARPPAGSHRDHWGSTSTQLFDPTDPTRAHSVELPNYALRSGPRRTIYHDPKQVVAAIVTCEYMRVVCGCGCRGGVGVGVGVGGDGRRQWMQREVWEAC